MVDTNAMRKAFVVPDVKPLDQYDFTRAKICANLGWLLTKAYGRAENVPVELRDPFYRDQYEQEHIKPPVTNLLLSSELYCRVCGLLLGACSGASAPPRDNATLLQLLTKRGLAPKDQDVLVTEADLRQKPIKMSAHLAVINELMVMDAVETVKAVKIPGEVEQLGSGASWENALFYWVNRLTQRLRESEDQSQGSQPSTELQSVQPANRYRKDKSVPKHPAALPLVTSIKDLSDGCALAAVIHFYCPTLLQLEDVCLKDTMSVADSLYNLQLIREFCDDYLQGCCPLALEDLLYTPPALQLNIMSFGAELLSWFELRKPDFVQALEPLDLKDVSGLSDCLNKNSASSNSASPSTFRQPFLPISSSMSTEGVGKTWTKKPFSRPLSSAVSFSIPFGLDSDVEVVMGNPLTSITRSVSSDNLNPAGQVMTRAPYTPPEDLSHLVSQGLDSSGHPASHRASWATQPRPTSLRAEPVRSMENGLGEGADLPTIEEALQIIHNESKLEPRLHPDGAPDGFYLHSPDGCIGSPTPLSTSAPPRTGMLYHPGEEREVGRRRTRRTSDGSRDDDSVLRDGSVDSDASEDLAKPQVATPVEALTPASRSSASHGDETPDSGVKMTSFAERKKKLVPEMAVSDTPVPHVTTWAQKSEESPGKSPALNTEMSDLGARLEEKRRAIEAQKKRIEAIFAKHRQQLGKNAFLQLKREQQSGDEAETDACPSSTEEDQAKSGSEERIMHMENEEQPSPVDVPGKAVGPPTLEKQVTFSKGLAPLGDYNNAVSKLSAALSSLQTDMQRLSEQQTQLLRKKGAASPSTQTWVIPGPSRSGVTPTTRFPREPAREHPSVASSASPSPSRKSAPPKSPQAPHRRAKSAPPKSPKQQQQQQQHQSRPLELKFPPLTRVLTPPQNVDTLPHLRRVSPRQCQVQTSSSFSIGALQDAPARPTEDNTSENGSSEDPAVFPLDLDGGSVGRDRGGESGSGAPSECSFESDVPAAFGGKRSSLIEIPLSSLRDDDVNDLTDTFSDSMSDQTEPEIKGGVGFFFKEDEARPEDEMAQRRAALLEKQQKRAEEMKRRRREQEKEREARLSTMNDARTPGAEETSAPSHTPPPARTPPPEGTPQRRGDFTRQEYQRRQQLKIMEDLDKVLRQKPTTVRSVKKQRPRTIFRDDSVLSRSPAKGSMDSRLNKVYSHSTLNLSSMANDPTSNGGTLTKRKSPSRSHSPSRLMSPNRVSSQNGEKDWDVASTISSPASVPEYTGPKLYKEPSFKSNKFIIHNAISRCCLAGKVNEPQKKKIVEEMEKSTANHFLILFRDSSCQFRAVYTMNPETEELVRLAGIGPRVVCSSMVESIYKYSSDRKQFSVIPSKTMSMSVDAFTIPAQLWQTKRPTTPKKLSTPK